MRLVVLAIVLGLEHFMPALARQRLRAQRSLWQQLESRARRCTEVHPLFATVGGAVVIGVVAGWLAGRAPFWHAVFSGLVLWLGLGPRALAPDVARYLRACAVDAAHLESALDTGLLDEAPLNAEDRRQAVLAGIATASYRRVFAPVAWFAVLGAAGVALYRLADLARIRTPSGEVARLADALDWVPARIYALLLGVAGSLPPVWSHVASLGVRRAAAGVVIGPAAVHALGHAEYGRIVREDEQVYWVNALSGLIRRAYAFAVGVLILGWLALD